MTDVTPTDSDNMRELRRIGPIAQALFTVAFAVAACILALVLMGSIAAPTPAPTVLAPAPQQLASAPTAAGAGVPMPSSISSIDVLPEPQPPTF